MNKDRKDLFFFFAYFTAATCFIDFLYCGIGLCGFEKRLSLRRFDAILFYSFMNKII